MTETGDPHIMYLAVRTSLGMSPGKIAAQVGHAVEIICTDYATDRDPVVDVRRTPEECTRVRAAQEWRGENSTKIILAASDGEFERMKTIPGAVIVTDLGRTEVAPNTETVIGLWPMRRSARPNFLKRMRVLT